MNGCAFAAAENQEPQERRTDDIVRRRLAWAVSADLADFAAGGAGEQLAFRGMERVFGIAAIKVEIGQPPAGAFRLKAVIVIVPPHADPSPDVRHSLDQTRRLAATGPRFGPDRAARPAGTAHHVSGAGHGKIGGIAAITASLGAANPDARSVMLYIQSESLIGCRCFEDSSSFC